MKEKQEGKNVYRYKIEVYQACRSINNIYNFLWTTSVCFAEEVILPFWNVLNLFLGILRGYLKDIIHIFFIVLNLLILNLSSQLLLLYFVYYIFFHFLHFGKLLFSRLKSFLLECVLKHWKLFDCERDGRKFGNIYYLNEQRIREKENDRK